MSNKLQFVVCARILTLLVHTDDSDQEKVVKILCGLSVITTTRQTLIGHFVT